MRCYVRWISYLLNSYYKYTNIETAKAILTNQSFRYSSPLNFNDPFDIQNELYTEFDIDDFTSIVMSRIKEYLKGNRDIPPTTSENGNAILQLKQAIELKGINVEKVAPYLQPLIEAATKRFKESLDYQNNAWFKAMQKSRVFCVTEAKDNLLMWSHYAQDHTGIVFELENINKKNNLLSQIKKVNYKDKPISYFSLEELIKWTLFQVEPDYSKVMYATHAWHKSLHWEYEQEWRVIEICDELDKHNLHLDRQFTPTQLKSITLGCKTTVENTKVIRSMAELINPSINVYKAVKKVKEFGLYFTKI